MKLYGTHARKGDNIEERPHRMAKILSLPEEVRAVTLEMLQALAAEVTDKKVTVVPEPIRASKPGFDVESYLKDHGIKIKGVRFHGTSALNVLEECVFDPTHKGVEAATYDFTLRGERHTEAWLKTKKEASQTEAGRRAELDNPKPVVVTPTDTTFLALVNDRLDHIKAHNSVRH
jgi:hypothetical protein